MTVVKDRFLLGEVLGEGGFGITYLALDIEHQNRVAVKEYFPRDLCERGETGEVVPQKNRHAYNSGVDHFFHEAQILQRLNSCPSVVNVKSYFRENNTAYLIMEYVQGESVKAYANHYDGAHIPWPQAKFVTTQIALALSEVHRQGIVHSDISPSNIVILPDGDVKLIDFGASKSYLKSQGGDVIVQLKPGFAPPEQYDSQCRNLGPWTDIYALACTFCFMVMGNEGHVPSVSERKKGAPLPNIRQCASEEEIRAARAIEKALELDFQKRYQSIDAFLQDFAEPEESYTDTKTPSTDEKTSFLPKKWWSKLLR